MVKFRARRGRATDTPCDVLVVNLFQGEKRPEGASLSVDRALKGLLAQVIGEEKFKGEAGQTLVIHTHGKIPARKVMVVGLGKREEFDLDKVRRASAAAVKRAASMEAVTMGTVLHGEGAGSLVPQDCAQALVEGAELGSYRFVKYKTEEKGPRGPSSITIIVQPDGPRREGAKLAAVKKGIRLGQVFAGATNLARDLINEPAAVVTPTAMARMAQKIAREGGLKCEVFDRRQMARMGMGAILGVAKGSAEPPQFIVLTYVPARPARRRVALVGKGITFDSGGLNIKTAEWMLTMKDDMSGAAAVLATMSALPKLNPPVEVMGLIPATENMPGPRAYKQGDVLKAFNGKTIEISNTDAEGRLILADALAFAAKQKVDEVVDIATLTGACIVALGNNVSGIMGNDQGLVDRMMEAGSKAGEKMWQLPLFDDYREHLKSEVADIKNSGGREAGASQGGIFLKEFVGDRKWVHIDIAGPSFLEKDRDDCPKGGSGVGVRSFLNFLTRG